MRNHFIILVIIIFVSCTSETKEDLIIKSIKINNLKTPIVAHRKENNLMVKDIKGMLLFKTTKELISLSDENFYTLFIKEDDKKIGIGFTHYKSGFDYYTVFDKKNYYKILSNDYIQTKRGESKEYDLYWEIVKDK